MRKDPTALTGLCLILVVIIVRLAGTDWDSFAGLHPDERHMVFIVTDMINELGKERTAALAVFDIWFTTGSSPLDPRANGRVFVYGEAPVIIVALLAKLLMFGNWFEILALGRIVTTLVEGSAVLAVFILAQQLYGRLHQSCLAAVLYASAPTTLQLTNFFTVDAWLIAAFAWIGVVLIAFVRSQSIGRIISYQFIIGIIVGLAVATKLTGLVLLLPVGLVIVFQLSTRGWRIPVLSATLIVITTAATFRLANPFAFAGPGFFDITPAAAFIDGIAAWLKTGTSSGFPPNWQWIAGYSKFEFLRDMVLFGCGPVMAVLICVAGFARRSLILIETLILLALVLPLLLYTMLSFNPVLRYAAPVLPVVSVLAIAGVTRLRWVPLAVIAIIALWWGSGMILLHNTEHPRIAASRWLWNLPAGTVLANETAWDEALPTIVSLEPNGEPRWPTHAKHFKFVNLDLTQPDTIDKARKVASNLAAADYVVISSGRQREIMPRLPKRFPMTTAYYRLLSRGDLCYVSVWRTDRGYPLFPRAFDDSWAQEPWRVYDHPIVEIFQKRACFDESKTYKLLQAALHK